MKYLLILCISCLALSQKSVAQNNAIFYGGVGDGFGTSSYAQSNNAIYLGGGGDGFSNNNYSQLGNATMYIGGNGDGFAAVNYVQSDDFKNIFLGGSGDGWHVNNYDQKSNDRLYYGGNGDGFALLKYDQASSNMYLGGDGDGFTKLTYEQASNDVYLGGIGDGWAGNTFPLGPLPIDFISFTGKDIDGIHLLHWQTSTEKNASHFVIEHSRNGNQFLELGMRNATNTMQFTSYQFANQKPELGDNYYRLKMVNANKDFIYSNVILLKKINEQTTVIVYPNPAADQISILINSDNDKQQADIEIVNANGSIVYSKKKQQVNTDVNVDITTWANGIYYAKIKIGAQFQIIKMIKNK
jgi:Secretion system C-terminal sorting domain